MTGKGLLRVKMPPELQKIELTPHAWKLVTFGDLDLDLDADLKRSSTLPGTTCKPQSPGRRPRHSTPTPPLTLNHTHPQGVRTPD